MQFTLRQVEIFVAACDAGSLTRAAEDLHVAQSAISTAIKTLERALDVTLLVRVHATGVSPTPEGREFLRRARELLQTANELAWFAESLGEAVAGPVYVGCLVTVSPIVMPTLIRLYEERHPRSKVMLVEGDQEELIRLLRTGQINLAITYNIGLEHGLTFRPMLSAPPQVLMTDVHPLAKFERLTIGQIWQHPMILLDLPISRDYFLGLFRAEMHAPNIVYRSPHMDVVRSMVGQGMGYTLINLQPGTSETMDGQHLVMRPLVGVTDHMSLGVAVVQAPIRSANAKAFIEHVSEWASGRWGWVPGASRES
jgi:DNA-binding transcriptional LysR family regulator